MKAGLKMVREKALEYIDILMVMNSKDNGKMMKKFSDNIDSMMVDLSMAGSKRTK